MGIGQHMTAVPPSRRGSPTRYRPCPQPFPQPDLTLTLPCRLLTDIARGLEYMGQHGFGHNDMKPGNVLVYEESGVLVAKITDLGAALCESLRCSLLLGAVLSLSMRFADREVDAVGSQTLPYKSTKKRSSGNHTSLSSDGAA